MSAQQFPDDAPLRTWALLARAPWLHAGHLAAAFEFLAAPAPPLKIGGHGPDQRPLPAPARAWLAAPDWRRVDADLRWLARADVTLLPWHAPDYPQQLRHLAEPPAALYLRGDPEVLHTLQVAMIGSRNPTGPGLDTARRFALYLARAGLTITSGMALGIDAASHRGALQAGGGTVAVWGTGLDCIYPPEHAELAEQIAARGALLSEFPPGTSPRRENFPRRNRIISGLAQATLVVEAARGSGSLITARHTLNQGGNVYALPGSIHSPLSFGCHQLIRDGAQLVTSAAEFLDDLKLPLQKQYVANVVRRGDSPLAMDKEYEILLDALGFEPASIDTLVERTGLQSAAIASMLLILELGGSIQPQPGGRYCRLPSVTEQ
jgi:DNA processing protein